jgi:hypothetical protein
MKIERTDRLAKPVIVEIGVIHPVAVFGASKIVRRWMVATLAFVNLPVSS